MILNKLRKAVTDESPLPDLPSVGPWQTFDDPLDRFCEVLQSVGGTCLRVIDRHQAHEQLQQIPEWRSAVVRVSVVDDVGDSTVNLAETDDPHDLENVDFAVLRGHFGVAENAAIWVTDDTLKHRVLYFLPQRLAIVIPAREIVHNMHEAYARISVGHHPFAGFISGPSKTADIEQSLVIGAHGARALTVFAVEDL
ncbi:MAG: LUD domain-containing protein [Planctomycetaceae bacterium]|nr:LUD domain-containing protein [Planctomycetaceae bacterium]